MYRMLPSELDKLRMLKAEKILLENLEIAKVYVKEDISRTHCYLARLYTIKGNTKKALSNIKAAEKNICFFFSIADTPIQVTKILYAISFTNSLIIL